MIKNHGLKVLYFLFCVWEMKSGVCTRVCVSVWLPRVCVYVMSVDVWEDLQGMMEQDFGSHGLFSNCIFCLFILRDLHSVLRY